MARRRHVARLGVLRVSATPPACRLGGAKRAKVAGRGTRLLGMARERVSEIVAEMVANVMSVSVEPGDQVEAGDVVIILESMKMEIPVMAEGTGTVRAVKIAPADVVQEGDVLVEIVLTD